MIQISPKAFFFDFDGVICDSEKAHMFSTMKAIKEHNIQFSEDYYFEKLFGFDDVGLFEHLFAKHGKELSPQTLKELMVSKNVEFMETIEEHILFFDGVKDLILRLHENKVPLAVVSGALSSEVKACLKKGKLDSYFEFIVCADHVRRSKPDPESYEKAFEKMVVKVPDLELQSCWVLEDSPTGISSAVGAGLKVIGITNSAAAPVLSEADVVIQDYSEIQMMSF